MNTNQVPDPNPLPSLAALVLMGINAALAASPALTDDECVAPAAGRG
jgi:hypothetical protein